VVSIRTLPIHFSDTFAVGSGIVNDIDDPCSRMYRLATLHSVTDRRHYHVSSIADHAVVRSANYIDDFEASYS